MTGLAGLLAAALRAQGLTDDPATYDSDIHSWRCSHPDIYGPCSCFQEVVDDVAAAVTAWLADRLGSEEVREACAEAAGEAMGYFGEDARPADASGAAVAALLAAVRSR